MIPWQAWQSSGRLLLVAGRVCPGRTAGSFGWSFDRGSCGQPPGAQVVEIPERRVAGRLIGGLRRASSCCAGRPPRRGRRTSARCPSPPRPPPRPTGRAGRRTRAVVAVRVRSPSLVSFRNVSGRACASAHRVRSGTGPTRAKGGNQKGRRREGCRPERRSGRAVAQQETLTRNAAVLPLTFLTVISSPPRESWWSGRAAVYTMRGRPRKGQFLLWFPARRTSNLPRSTADPWSIDCREVLFVQDRRRATPEVLRVQTEGTVHHDQGVQGLHPARQRRRPGRRGRHRRRVRRGGQVVRRRHPHADHRGRLRPAELLAT